MPPSTRLPLWTFWPLHLPSRGLSLSLQPCRLRLSHPTSLQVPVDCSSPCLVLRASCRKQAGSGHIACSVLRRQWGQVERLVSWSSASRQWRGGCVERCPPRIPVQRWRSLTALGQLGVPVPLTQKQRELFLPQFLVSPSDSPWTALCTCVYPSGSCWGKEGGQGARRGESGASFMKMCMGTVPAAASWWRRGAVQCSVYLGPPERP